MPSNKRTSGRQPIVEQDTPEQTNGEQSPVEEPREVAPQPRSGDAGPPAGGSGAPPAPRTNANEDARRARGLNITDLKDKSIQQLTQIAKDLAVAGATST